MLIMLSSGIDRIFISDHQKFSKFFIYEIVDKKQVTIDYYAINDSESGALDLNLSIKRTLQITSIYFSSKNDRNRL